MRLMGFLKGENAVCVIDLSYIEYDCEEEELYAIDVCGDSYIVSNVDSVMGLSIIQHLTMDSYYVLERCFGIIIEEGEDDYV